MKRTRCIAIYAILVIAVLCVLGRISLPHIIPRVANPILSRQLGTDVEIAGVRLELLRGRAAIDTVTLAQPEGFTNAPPLMRITHPQGQLRLSQLFKMHAQIPKAQVETLEIHIVRNEDGVLNLQQMLANRPAKTEPKREPRPPREKVPTLTLTHFSLPEALITFTDLSVTPPVVLTITNIQIEAHALRFDPLAAATSTTMPGRIQATGTLLQPGLPDGYLGAVAALGISAIDIPPINAAVRVVGFDLRSIRGMLPHGVATFLGGSNLDVVVDAAVAPEFLRVQNRVYTLGNTWRLAIGGTPRNIEFDTSTALFNLVTRPGAFLTGAAGGVADAGMAAGRTVVSTAGRAGSGIVSGVANIGRGAARTVQSAARADLRGVGDGMVDMTYGTVTGAVDTVTTTARGVGEGIGETVSAAAGRSQSRSWENANAARWAQRWEDALDFALNAPFPGSVALARLEPASDPTNDPDLDAPQPTPPEQDTQPEVPIGEQHK